MTRSRRTSPYKIKMADRITTDTADLRADIAAGHVPRRPGIREWAAHRAGAVRDPLPEATCSYGEIADEDQDEGEQQ